MEPQTIYQPSIPQRFTDLTKLSPSDPIRTLVATHRAVGPIGQQIVTAAAAIDADQNLSAEGRKTAREKAFSDLVGSGMTKHDAPLRLASLRLGEQQAALEKKAIAKATVSEARALRVAEWLRDMDATARNSLVLESIMQGDIELIASCLSAPVAWKILTPQLKERATLALIQRQDADRAAELDDFRGLIAACRESFESLARFGRDQLKLTPPPAKPALRTKAA
jgi:hypothetical protein